MDPKIIHVEKLCKDITLTFNNTHLLIQGDTDPYFKHKRARSSRSCIPTNTTTPVQVVSISYLHILHAMYHHQTNMIQIATLVSEPFFIYKFMYTVKDNEQQKAIDYCQYIMDCVYRDSIAEKKLLVLIHPFSGQKRAKAIFQESVRPLLEAAKCTLEIQYTEHQNHAFDIAKNKRDLEQWDAIVTVSGDGLIHEVINGLLQRTDHVIQKIALAVIPAGTTNALSISMHGSKKGFDPIHCALQIIKGRPLALDICSVTYDDHHYYYSFLFQYFGMAGLRTDYLRWMGDYRLVVGLLQGILSNTSYEMEASLWVIESDKTKIKASYQMSHVAEWHSLKPKQDALPCLTEPVPEHWVTIKDSICIFLASKVPLLSRGILSHPCAIPNDGLLDLIIVRAKQSMWKQLSALNHVNKGKHMDLDHVEYYKIKAFRLTPKIKPGQDAYVAIDGQHIPLKPFQVQVHPCLVSVLSLNPTFTPYE
ncbi:ATP-NAD kinase-like domain-containing protein [Gilbertella persicaria]|uniref:ATP-NAD kinase-like domain-containing protein n=1 Tax=Gilbertella persicaria TaxID=101096 RepID=UPI00221EE41C|nr:ATP-NAD kinase-like domain-containing protein [Gilbertella persicaria]KAI8051049.1 ATP-NAD kinase-like domain-containing protein [Gilbertella persicaria]